MLSPIQASSPLGRNRLAPLVDPGCIPLANAARLQAGLSDKEKKIPVTTTAYRDQNDAIRTSGDFGPDTANPLLLTPGVQALGSEAIARLYLAVMTFDAFNKDLDPTGAHDMGSLSVGDTEVWFRIDPAAKPDQRIFTLLLPEEH